MLMPCAGRIILRELKAIEERSKEPWACCDERAAQAPISSSGAAQGRRDDSPAVDLSTEISLNQIPMRPHRGLAFRNERQDHWLEPLARRAEKQ